MESVEEVRRKNKEKESRFGRRYGFEIKLRCVKLHLEEGLPIFFVVEGSGGQYRRYSSLGEGVSGAGRGRITESSEVVGEVAETSRSGAREDC